MRGTEKALEVEGWRRTRRWACSGLIEGLGATYRAITGPSHAGRRVGAAEPGGGVGALPRDKVQYYRIAYASSREASAAVRLLVGLRTVPAADGERILAMLDSVQAITWKLIFPNR
ncbi:MAG: hypothetical protein H6746_09655 [Deltaproteobacteria bacterium]|nr:hypothetical protein [Deltaproteobacteria bacterium]